MNKAITDGVVLMPTPFAQGLDNWSSGNGTPGSGTYDGSASASVVYGDQDFGSAMELLKTDAVQSVRFTGETPLSAGCYLQIRARVKAISGNLPTVRIAGYAARSNGSEVTGLTTTGPEVELSTYGEVVEVTAIVGSGARPGVDMVWGLAPAYGHFGLDLTGQNGGIVRIDDIEITDVTGAYAAQQLGRVDVVDYGARGDGSADDTAAFEAANTAAAGTREVYVPAGNFRLTDSVTFDARVTFEGQVTMPTEAILLLRRNFDLPSYIDAFGTEEVAFRKAFQALLNNADHDSLDLCGRKVTITGPVDMQAAVPDRTSYATRRVIRNGQLEAANSSNWDPEVVSSQATYDTSDARTLTNVVNVANVPVGALVEGTGVGREVYVRAKNVATGEVTLNAPLYDAVGTQNFTFTRFRYMLDFSGFSLLSKFVLSDIEFQCNNRSSGILLAPSGVAFHLRDCFVTRPADRGVTSTGNGCQGMLIDRCQFLSAEDSLSVSQRKTIGFNANANDVKLRDNRATRFLHFGLLAGANSIITGNHFFQGDEVDNGVRSAGLVLANTHVSSVFSGNYVDNCFLEWTNEQDPFPAFSSEYSFSALSVTDNIFLSGEVAPWFSYIVVKPHGAGHFLSGVSIVGNRFRSLNGSIDRAERVDTSFADLDLSRCKNVVFTQNSFHAVSAQVESPALIDYTQATPSDVWTIDAAGYLPFGGQALKVDAVQAQGALRNGNNVRQWQVPYADVAQGAQRDQVELHWESPVRGRVQVTVRMDQR